MRILCVRGLKNFENFSNARNPIYGTRNNTFYHYILRVVTFC